jgi:hypothetical protein
MSHLNNKDAGIQRVSGTKVTKEDHALNVGRLKEVKLAILEETQALEVDKEYVDALIKEQLALETAICLYVIVNGPLW